MRFVPVYCIREGMVSASKLVGKNGELLLNSGSVIYSSYIKRLEDMGFNGIYIDDELSKDIQITDVISSDLRHKTVQSIKNAFISIEKGEKLSEESKAAIDSLVSEIVDNLMSNKHLMVNMVDLKSFDDYTFHHSVNVGVLCILLGTALGFNKKQLHNLGLAALLHDIGKVFIPKDILNKPGKLAKSEYEVMKAHSVKGYGYLKDMFEIPTSSYIAVLQHHERCDGTGYPNSIMGPQISMFGKIIAVADVYDAFISNRPYRKAVLPSDAMEYIMGGSDLLFDSSVVNMFTQKIAPYPVGTCVEMSDKRVGIVVENYSDCCLRPKIKVIKHDSEQVDPYFLDLRSDRSAFGVTIVGISDIC